MSTRWSDWYWKGAGAFGAGYVPVGYVTTWSPAVSAADQRWYDCTLPSGYGGGGYGVGGYGGFSSPVWSMFGDSVDAIWTDIDLTV
jgi:hypothetical protein